MKAILSLIHAEELSDFVKKQRHLQKAIDSWNQKNDTRFTRHAVVKLIDNVRNHEPSYFLKGIFNQIPGLPGREWTNLEELMFYIYLDYGIENDINEITMICDFAQFSGRITMRVVYKAYEYTPMLKFFKKTTVSKVASLVDTLHGQRSKRKSIDKILSIYASCSDELESHIDKQCKQFIPVVSKFNNPIKPKVSKPEPNPKTNQPFGLTDLITKFNTATDVESPPFTPAEIKSDPVVSPFTSMQDNSDPDDPSMKRKTATSNKSVVVGHVGHIGSKNISMHETQKLIDTMLSVRLKTEIGLSAVRHCRHKMFDIIRNTDKFVANPKSINKQLKPHMEALYEFQNSATKSISDVHDVVVILLRALCSQKAIANLLNVPASRVKWYVTEARQAGSAEFLRRSRTGKMILTTEETDHVYRYLCDLRNNDNLGLFDSLNVASFGFNFIPRELIRVLNKAGYLSGDIAKAQQRLINRMSTMNRKRNYLPVINSDLALVHKEIPAPHQLDPIKEVAKVVKVEKNKSTIQVNPMAAYGIINDPLFEDIWSHKVVIEEEVITTPVIKFDAIRIRRTLVQEFLKHRCIKSDNRLSFDDMHKAFTGYCVEKRVQELDFKEFNQTMISLTNRSKESDPFGNYYWTNVAFYDEDLIKTEEEVKFEHLCRTITLLFPNVSVTSAIPLVKLLQQIGDKTELTLTNLDDMVSILTLNNLKSAKISLLNSSDV